MSTTITEDNNNQNIWQDVVNVDTLREQVRRNRHEAVIDLNDEIEQLGHLFQQVDTRATEQSPLMDHIEVQAINIEEDLRDSNEEIEGTIEKKEQGNRCKCYGVLALVLALVIFVLVLKYT